MHTLKIDIDDTVYSKFKAFLDLMPKDKVRVVSDRVTPESPLFVVSSKEEVRRRVKEAEERGEYLSQEEYDKEMDEFMTSL